MLSGPSLPRGGAAAKAPHSDSGPLLCVASPPGSRDPLLAPVLGVGGVCTATPPRLQHADPSPGADLRCVGSLRGRPAGVCRGLGVRTALVFRSGGSANGIASVELFVTGTGGGASSPTPRLRRAEAPARLRRWARSGSARAVHRLHGPGLARTSMVAQPSRRCSCRTSRRRGGDAGAPRAALVLARQGAGVLEAGWGGCANAAGPRTGRRKKFRKKPAAAKNPIQDRRRSGERPRRPTIPSPTRRPPPPPPTTTPPPHRSSPARP